MNLDSSDALSRFDGYVFRDEREHPKFTIGIVVLLYYFDGKSAGKMQARLQVLQDFLARFRSNVNAFMPLMTDKVRKGDSDAILAYFSDMASNPKRNLGSMSAGFYREGREPGEPQPYSVEISAGPTDAQLSQIVCYIPAGWLDEVGVGALVDLVRRWSSWIGAAHGTAGLGLQFNQAVGQQARDVMFPYIKRYPGLEIGDRSDWMLEMKQHEDQRFIRSTNWLTLIDDGFVSTLGGRAAIEKQIGPDSPMHEFDGGLVIQAGERPQLGDVNYDDIPVPYRRVSDALKPIRYERFSRFGMFEVPSMAGRLDQMEESGAWVRRFD